MTGPSVLCRLAGIDYFPKSINSRPVSHRPGVGYDFVMKFGILVFPGTWSDRDCGHALETLGQEIEYVWHADTDVDRFDALVVPGGFSYGDYLRAGAIARFSPVMESVSKFAVDGRGVIGICNGFQILCEAGLLPGALMRNNHLEFRCEWTDLRVENDRTMFSHTARSGDLLRVPISHGEGSYQADEDTISELEANKRVVFRYSGPAGEVTPKWNPNGSVNNIAGIINETGNVLGMMPHPERACDPLIGGEDGAAIFRAMFTEISALS